MKYRLRLDLILNADKGTLADNVYTTLLQQLGDDAQVINEGLNNEERSRMQLEECYHDETPVLPCVVLREVSK